jgi:hypothetical protein
MTVALTTSGKPGMEVHACRGGTPIRRGTTGIDANKRSETIRDITVSRARKTRITVK